MNLLADLTERGLVALDTALTESARQLDRWTGARPTAGDPELPPGHPDDVTSALANEAVRAVRRGWWSPVGLGVAAREVFASTMQASRDGWTQWPLSARAVLPLRLPLAVATLTTQEGLRALASYRSVPADRLVDFVAFVIETFSDLDTYFSLRYRREIGHYEALLRVDPGDARARLELGRTYLKLGLFDRAVETLRAVESRSRSIRRNAHFAALVAATRAGDLAAAFAEGSACLELDPLHDNARYWLFLAADRAGGYPSSIPASQRMEALDGRHPTPIRLVDVTAEIGLDKISGGRGTAVADFFADGRQHVAISGAHAGISLFRNRGDGTFDDVSVGSGLESCVYGFALAAADYDNDGLPDLFVSSLGFYDGRSLLFHNEGGGVFRDVTREAGLGDWGPAFTATWVDIDGNGWLDLFVVHNLGGLFDRKVPNRLYRNNGDGTFTDITRDAGLSTAWSTIGACWGDFRNVGTP
ncbi:MAG: FG-GAP-like repeat-containing protein, partial [Acidobacteriota bacterium]